MKKVLTLLAIALFTFGYAQEKEATTSNDLTVEIVGFKKVDNSVLYVGVLDENGKEVASKKVDISKTTEEVKFTLEDLAKSKVALRMFQDLDGDGEMDRSTFGMPSEPFGFSNNPAIRFGPPTVEEMIVDLSSTSEIKVVMQ